MKDERLNRIFPMLQIAATTLKRTEVRAPWVAVSALRGAFKLASFALSALLLLAAPPSIQAQFSMGLYKDGHLIDTLGTIPQPPQAAAKQLSGAKLAPAAAQTLAASAISAETQARNQAFADSANAAIQIQETLRQMKSAPAAGFAPQTSPLATLLPQFLALQDQVRTAYAGIGNHVLELGLPPEIYQRHLDAVAAFEAGLVQFTSAVNDVLLGKPGALENALALMDQLKFRHEPDLTKAGPTRVPMQIISAPELTREQADAQRNSGAKDAQAKTSLAPAGLAAAPLAAAASPPTTNDLAETPDVHITAEIRAKAAALGNSPYAIYNFVKSKVAFQPYLGSRKGAVNTLRQLAGNDTDQASLLLALLRAAGIPCRYVRGTLEMTAAQAKSWLGVDDVGTAGDILATARLGASFYNGNLRCTRVWVEAYLPYGNYRGVPNDDTGKTWIPLDPAFKETIVTPGEDVLTAMGYNNEAHLANYVSAYNSNSPIEQLELDIQSWLNTNRPGKKVADIARSVATKTQDLGLLPASLPNEVVLANSPFSALSDTNRYKVRLHLYDEWDTTFIDFTTNLSQLAGHKVTISYVGATPAYQATIDSYGGIFQTPPYMVHVKPVLKVDGNPVATSVNSIGAGYRHSSDMHFVPPVGGSTQQPVVSNDIIAGNSQAIAFDTFMDTPDFFLADTNSMPHSLLMNLLHTTAVDYVSRVDRGEEQANRLLRTVHTVDVSEAIVESSVSVTYDGWTGVPQTFEWTGMIVDADRRIVGPFGADGDNSKFLPFMLLTGYDASFMENDVFEDMYNQKAVSTVRILQLASDRGIPICYITNSIASGCPGFNHSANVWTAVNDALSNRHVVIIPQTDITYSNWSGTGYIDLNPLTGAAGYIISGGINGNVTLSGGATVETWPVTLTCTPDPPNSLNAEVTSPANDSPDASAVFCPDNTKISFTIKLTYDCKDNPGQELIVSRTTTLTKKQIVDTYGPGIYTISVSGAPAVTGKHPRRIALAGIEFITPAGDPVAAPKDTGDGANEFTFNSASPGILEIPIKAKVVPSGIADVIKDKVLFKVDGIGSSVLSWKDPSNGGKPTADGDNLVVTAVFTGLPANNLDFGKKKAQVECNAVKQDEENYEVFYTALAKNHPGGAATDPNWFYYYKQNAGGGQYTYTSVGRSTSSAGAGQSSVKIGDEAYSGDTYITTKVVGGQLEATGTGTSSTTQYYANFLGVLAHESQHASNETTAGPPTDADSDFLLNTFEIDTSKTDPNVKYSARGVLRGSAWDDGEVYAGGPVEEQGIKGANTSQDWANPGTNKQ